MTSNLFVTGYVVLHIFKVHEIDHFYFFIRVLIVTRYGVNKILWNNFAGGQISELGYGFSNFDVFQGLFKKILNCVAYSLVSNSNKYGVEILVKMLKREGGKKKGLVDKGRFRRKIPI